MTCIGPPWFFTYRYKTCVIVESCLILTKETFCPHMDCLPSVRVRVPSVHLVHLEPRCPENLGFQNFRISQIFKFQWWWKSYILDLLVRGSLIVVGFLRIKNSQEIVKLSLTTSNLLYDKSVRKSHDKNWKKVKYKSDVWIGRGFYIYWYSEVITRKKCNNTLHCWPTASLLCFIECSR